MLAEIINIYDHIIMENDMTFLNAIDNIYDRCRENLGIPQENLEFSCYIPIEVVGYEPLCRFVIQKKDKKAKLLLLEGKQRVYISDLHILNTILDMENDDVEWFLQEFVKLYKGQEYQIKFKFDEQIFDGYGIDPYPHTKEL